MLIKEVKTKTINEEVVIDTVCNLCEKSIGINNDNFQGCRIFIEFGYGSKYDGELCEGHICDDCYDRNIGKLKISPSRF